MRLTTHHRRFELDVDFTLNTRERIAIVGPNAAGKSTLLAAWLAAETVRGEHPSTVLLEQNALCFPHMSAAENIAFSLQANGASRLQAQSRAQELLADAQLEAIADSLPEALSGGQQQRVALLRALATGASTVLLDEPLAGLDVRAAREYRSMLLHHSDAIERLVVVTHDAIDVRQLATRVLVLENGGLAADCSVEQFFQTPPNPFSAQLVDTNRVVLGNQVAWFTPASATLTAVTEDPESGSEPFTLSSSVVRMLARVTSIERRAHTDRVILSVAALTSSGPPDDAEVCVDLSPSEAQKYSASMRCQIEVPVRAVRMAAE